MQVTDRDVERIPAGNTRVPRGEFVTVWVVASHYPGDVPSDWYGAGVEHTCRWIAAGIERPSNGLWCPAPAPVTHRSAAAYEELIQAEYIAADRLELREPRPDWLVARPGWIEGITATFRWAWARKGPPPLAVSATAPAR